MTNKFGPSVMPREQSAIARNDVKWGQEPMVQGTSQPILCAYCGAPATTRDHVPPKGLFAKPRPSNLITVPSCLSCNQAAASDDELFRLFLTLREELEDHPQAAQVADSVLRSLQRHDHPGLRRLIAPTLKEVERTTITGLYAGRAATFSVPLQRIVAVSDRITRGLFYHHFHRQVPKKYSVISKPASSLDPTDTHVLSFIRDLVNSIRPSVISISTHEFRYGFKRAQEDPNASFWVYVFYNKISFLSAIVPESDPAHDAG